MQKQILGYWVMMATRGGEMQLWGRPNTPDSPFVPEVPLVSEEAASALAARVASMSTTDSVYVMTVYGDGTLNMETICRPARDPNRPTGDAHPPGPGFTGMAGF